MTEEIERAYREGFRDAWVSDPALHIAEELEDASWMSSRARLVDSEYVARATVIFLRRMASGERRHASALRDDAGTQAEPQARVVERGALALERAADAIEQGMHLR